MELSEININRITYSNLSYGNYQLIISKLERDGQPSNRPHILNIRILPPWYYTIWAKAIYILLLLSLIAWTINFFRVKNRLKAERREKEKYWNSPVRKWHSSPTYPMS